MVKKAALLALATVSVLGAGTTSAYATGIGCNPCTFDFNSLAATSAGSTANTAIQNYMNGLMTTAGAGLSVAVNGATISNTYTGDGHVVGGASPTTTSLTLGNTDGGVFHGGANDTFLDTETNSRITMKFTPAVSQKIYQVSFDYEIFPDGGCPGGTGGCSGGLPDFHFLAGNYAPGSITSTTVGGAGTNPQINNPTPVGLVPGTNGILPYSPASGSSVETAPQLPSQTVTYYFAQGVTALEFVDWPATIGIDNLKITTTPPSGVPEPASMIMLGTGLAGLAARRLRARKTRTL